MHIYFIFERIIILRRFPLGSGVFACARVRCVARIEITSALNLFYCYYFVRAVAQLAHTRLLALLPRPQ